MQLNKQTDYALRVLMYLALKQTQGLANIDDIVERFHIPRNHLTKIIAKLNKLGLIKTYRGTNGGLELVPATLQINLAEIVAKFENVAQVINCRHLSCPIAGMCRLKSVLDQASLGFSAVLAGYTLEQMLPSDSQKLSQMVAAIS
ncbi:MAG: Rrf2 family transcriptional regulator [Burkholderiales bacterium]|nr:Rrf2 family transcriptional regulator [Burkholderiales bacterium]